MLFLVKYWVNLLINRSLTDFYEFEIYSKHSEQLFLVRVMDREINIDIVHNNLLLS